MYFEWLLIVFNMSLLLISLAGLIRKKYIKLTYGSELKLHGLAVLVCLTVPLLHLLPSETWIPVNRATQTIEYRQPLLHLSEVLKINAYSKNKDRKLNEDVEGTSIGKEAFLIFMIVIALMGLFLFLKELVKSYRMLRKTHHIKGFGKVRLKSSESITSPICMYFFGKSYVVIPEGILNQPKLFQIARWHEYEHLRSGDAIWSYFLYLLKCMSFINPLVHGWIGRIHTLQEVRCDQRVIRRNNINKQQYAMALIQTIESIGRPRDLYLSVGMGVTSSVLKERIICMKNKESLNSKWRFLLAAAFVVSVGGLSSIAYSFTGATTELTLKQANALMASVKKKSDLPLKMNREILAELNKLLNTESGQAYTQKALENYKQYQAMIEETVGDYNFPKELRSVGFIESGFRNLPPSRNPVKAAGIWQFIKSTALRYGLNVNSNIDERLNEELETDAAMRLLGANYLRFQNWELSLLSYYLGGNRVYEATRRANSKDAWDLLSQGHLQDDNYLAKFYAAALIMNSKL
tara:strand:+ start:20394 stop:21956 length:1563 start_codon:yes stop_codon:yes gene_type:complete